MHNNNSKASLYPLLQCDWTVLLRLTTPSFVLEANTTRLAVAIYYFESHPPIIMINMNTLLSQLRFCLLLRLQHVRDHHSSEKVLTGRRQHKILCLSLLPEGEREPDNDSLCDHQRPGITCHGMLTHSFRSLCCSY